jgi:hypothetical protein
MFEHAKAQPLSPEAEAMMHKLSRGSEEYSELLIRIAQEVAGKTGVAPLTANDLNRVIEIALSKSPPDLKEAYRIAVRSLQTNNLYSEVLLAAALTPHTVADEFSSSEVKAPLYRITKRIYRVDGFTRHLNDFTTATRGEILRKSWQAEGLRFRFTNPLLPVFIILKGITARKIGIADI